MFRQKLFFGLILFLLAFFTLFSFNKAQAQELEEELSGRILLQVEENGEAWYVNPEDKKRYFMGRPQDAFELMRELGAGIDTAKLDQIPVGILNELSGEDMDKDGLVDNLEKALGTSIGNKDSDGDGYNDKKEIQQGYDPNGPGELELNEEFARSKAGNIFLQVEQNGEAWYINPQDQRRYFLGRPSDAFAIMRRLGLGITNSDLFQITIARTKSKEDTFSNNGKIEDWATTTSKSIYSSCGDPILDIESNLYKTVKIGEQCWMAENVRTTIYNDYVHIAKGPVYKDSQWSADRGYYSCPPNSSNSGRDCSSSETLGLLYQWSVVVDGVGERGERGICPEGWRIPNTSDFEKIKGQASELVDDSDYAGARDSTDQGGYIDRGEKLHLWSFDDGNVFDQEMVEYVFYKDGSGEVKMKQENVARSDGLSLRCIKD
ncbi:MAG TPA: FISUMP domain-containing protein [Patescibacteria group bacterium]|nr:FISUMP domain-containing protein [Patescibacteria group bacterium]